MTRKITPVLLLVASGLLVATCGGSGPTGPSLEQTAGEREQFETNTSGAGESFEPNSCPTPGNPSKTLVCHLPPGNPDNGHDICIDDSAVPAHLAHGDYLGECVACTPGDPYCCAPGDPYCHPGSR